MRLEKNRPPMLSRSARHFPLQITSPESILTDHRFIEDLEALGIWEVDARTFVRALCTLGEEVAEVAFEETTELASIRASDRCTSWLIFENGVEFQVEFFLGNRSGFGTINNWIPRLDGYTADTTDRLLFICDTMPSGKAKKYCEAHDHIEVYPAISEPQTDLRRL